MTTWGLVIAALLLGGLLGYLAQPATPNAAPVTAPLGQLLSQAPAGPSETPRQTPSAPREARTAREALVEIREMEGEFAQTTALYALAAHADAATVQNLIGQADKVFDRADAGAAKRILVSRLTELDPLGALKLAREAPALEGRGLMQAIFHTWSRMDFEAALEALSTLPNLHRSVAAQAIGRSLQPLTAVERDALSKAAPGSNAFGLAGGLTLDGDPEGSWQRALEQKSPQRRVQALMSVASLWAQLDPDSAMSAIRDAPVGTLRRSLESMVVQVWAQSEPRAAFEWLQRQPPSRQRQQQLGLVLQSLAAVDLPRAVAELDALSPQTRARVAGQLAPAWVAEQPMALIDWLDRQDFSTRQRQSVLSQAAASVANVAPDVAERWLDRLSGNEADMLRQQLVQVEAQTDPLRAADRLDTITDEKLRRSAARGLVSTWAQVGDSEAVTDWIDQQPKQEQTPLYSALVSILAYGAPTDAVALAAEHLDGKARERAYLNVLQSGNLEPAAAQRLAGELKDPALKQRAEAVLNQQQPRFGASLSVLDGLR